MRQSEIPNEIRDALFSGVVIPALPLALDMNRRLDERRQRAIIRYYLDAGVGGIAVAVHTTQFEIRNPEVNLYSELLNLARKEFDNFYKPLVRVAGVIGDTRQASAEAKIALEHKYHAALLGLASFKNASNEDIIQHCRQIADIIPIIGFYLQPAVGGRTLDKDFWREFAKIQNVIAIKIAPFNRYQTLEVIKGVAESGRADEIALYTGNDDSILVDLLTEYRIQVGDQIITKGIAGGLLGHWAVWTKKAVGLLSAVKKGEYSKDIRETLALANQITDCNAAFFDARNNFAGCIAGIHEVLRRQGFLEGIWLLNKDEHLSKGQKEEIDRVYRAYPHLNDDAFVAENLHRWLS